MREELKNRIKEIEEQIYEQESRGWEKNIEYLKDLKMKLERLRQLWDDMDY